MRRIMMPGFLTMVFLIFNLPALLGVNHLAYLKTIRKIDVHTHERANERFVLDFLEEENLKYVTICVDIGKKDFTKAQRDVSMELYQQYPRYYSWITTFDVEGIWEPGWKERTIARLREDFHRGAIGVKVWKYIGMNLKDRDGNFVQLDHPVFSPIFEFIAEQGKTLISHMGEPLQAWMPTYITEEGVHRNYWASHSDYHFYGQPDKPSYSDIIAAQDKVIENHPNLRFVGAHLASLEFNVSEIAVRMEMYPNFAVEVGGRFEYLMGQAREKVRTFFLKYQDRILFGTDLGVSSGMNDQERVKRKQRLRERNAQIARYLATDDRIPVDHLLRGFKTGSAPEYYVTGLALPKGVLKKFYYDNALRWLPGVEEGFLD